MATNKAFEAYFNQVAKNVSSGQSRGFDTAAELAKYGKLPTSEPVGGPVAQGAWSLGQGIIDFLSTGSYATAGIGRKIGQGVEAGRRGDVGSSIAALNPFGLLGGAGEGIAEKRSWSQNLQDLGVSEADSAGWGLALDIAVDPLWLVPGGAIAAGIKGTSRGVVAGAAASRAGVQLNKEAFSEASKRLAQTNVTPNTRERIERLSPLRDITIRGGKVEGPTADLYPAAGARKAVLSADGVGNLYRGIMQGNAENYAEWAALRKIRKAGKVVRKDDEAGIARFRAKYGVDPSSLLRPDPVDLLPAAAKAADDVANDVGKTADSPTFDRELPDTAADVAEATEKAVKEQTEATTKTPIEKDASAVQEAVDNVLDQAGAPSKSVFATARETVGPTRAEYLASRGLPPPAVDVATLANAKTAKIAGEIADEYDRMVSDPTNPQVIAAYKKLTEEVEDQFRFLTEEKGVKIEFVDSDPYVKTIDGVDVPDAQAMMKDVMENNTLKVFKTADDQVHPILTKDANDKFRAVHDYFGHAASGRSFQGDGEEAAWISHSMMFSPLARRAMTTETRGQNSWVNKFGLDENGRPFKFAEQKAGLLPDSYVALPSEYAALENVVAATNSLIGRSTAVLLNKADIILDDLGMVAQPMRGSEYKAEDFASIKKSLEKITDSELVKPGSVEHTSVLKTIDLLKNRIDGGARLSNIAEDLIELTTKLPGNSANALSKVLNSPTDATDLLTAAAAAEGRSLDLPKPFAPTTWSAKEGTYSKAPFTMEYLQRFFPDDPMLNNPKDLELAMGMTPASQAGVRAIKGETKEQALARKQSRLWEDFRTRNAEQLADVQLAEKELWKQTNDIPGSEIFAQAKSGLVGLGPIPLGIPARIMTSHNGTPTTTLAQILENLPAMIIREPIRMVRGTGGLETVISSALQRKVNVTREVLTKEGKKVTVSDLFDEVPSDQVLVYATSAVRGAKFDVVDAAGEPIPDWLAAARRGEGVPAGSQLVAANDAAREVIVKLKQLKSNIEIDRIQPVVKTWILGKLAAATNAVKNSSIRVSKPASSLDPASISMMARKLMDENPKVKSVSDAEMLVAGFEDAMKLLASKPKKKIFIKREDLTPTRGERKQKVDRSVETGAPNPYATEKVSRSFTAEGKSFPVEVDDADATLLTASGSQFTGRAPGREKLNRKYQTQTKIGTGQLAAVSNVMKAIDTIAGAISARELTASPEQAVLLGRVLTELGVKIAPEATPKQIFEQFQKNASIAYKDMIEGIESAAKSEAVMHQAQKAFTMSIDENMAILEAVEKTDPGELQRKVMQFTEDAVARVNEECRLRFGEFNTPAPPPTQFLDRVIRGE
jgi:hypothetical protein